MARSLVSNPPYNMAWTPPALAGLMTKYAQLPLPPKNNANYAFVLSSLALVDDKAALLLPNSVLQGATKEERVIIASLINGNLIEAVISLPERMFESTSIPTCIIVFNKSKQTQKIELIDLSNSAEQVEREQRGQFGGTSHTNRVYKKTVNVITQDVINKTLDAIENHVDEEGFSVSVTHEQIEQNDYKLTPKLYLQSKPIEYTHRSYKDIADDYNRIIRFKNQIKITFNETAAKRLGYDCLNENKPDLTDSFSVVGQKTEKENYITFTKSDGIKIECSTKEGVPDLIIDFLNKWKLFVMYYNNEENRILAELRDALLPDLMSGKIDVSKQ